MGKTDNMSYEKAQLTLMEIGQMQINLTDEPEAMELVLSNMRHMWELVAGEVSDRRYATLRLHAEVIPARVRGTEERCKWVTVLLSRLPRVRPLALPRTTTSLRWPTLGASRCSALRRRRNPGWPAATAEHEAQGALLLLEDPIDVRGVLLVAGSRAVHKR